MYTLIKIIEAVIGLGSAFFAIYLIFFTGTVHSGRQKSFKDN